MLDVFNTPLYQFLHFLRLFPSIWHLPTLVPNRGATDFLVKVFPVFPKTLPRAVLDRETGGTTMAIRAECETEVAHPGNGAKLFD